MKFAKDKRIVGLTIAGILFGVIKDLINGAENDIKQEIATKKAVEEYMKEHR